MKKLRENYPSSKWCFLLLFLEDKMTKDPCMFWRGGWKLRCESLAGLSFFLVEKVGDIVQLVK